MLKIQLLRYYFWFPCPSAPSPLGWFVAHSKLILPDQCKIASSTTVYTAWVMHVS